MKHTHSSVSLTLWVNRIIFITVIALLFFLPRLLGWYASIRLLLPGQEKAIVIAFYCCAAAILYALWCMEGLLRNIRLSQVFTAQNVRLIRDVGLCCGAVSLICFVAGFFYPPLMFLCVIMGFLSLVVNVVRHVICAAVVLREENELTI